MANNENNNQTHSRSLKSPSLGEAKRVRMESLPHREDNGKPLSVFSVMNIRNMERLGRGASAYLYFTFIMGLFLLGLAILTCPWMIAYWSDNHTNNMNNNENTVNNVHLSSANNINSISIGDKMNFKLNNINGVNNLNNNNATTDTDLSIPWRLSVTHWTSISDPSDRSTGITFLMGISRIAMTLYVMIFFRLGERYLRRKLHKIERREVTAADYSVYLRNAPIWTKPDTLMDDYAQQFGPVRAVSVALNTGYIAELKRKKKETEIRAESLHARILINEEKDFGFWGKVQHKWRRWRLRKLGEKVLRLQEKIERYSGEQFVYRCVGSAFITFHREITKYKCLHAANPPLFSCRSSPVYRGFKVDVEEAPEPEDIQWEHLEYSSASRRFRRLFSTFLCTVVFLVSFLTLYVLEIAKYETTEDNRQISVSLPYQSRFNVPEIPVSLNLGISAAFALVAFILNRILYKTLILLAGFEKHKFYSIEAYSQMLKLTISDIVTTMGITLLIYATNPYSDNRNYDQGFSETIATLRVVDYDFYTILGLVQLWWALYNVVFQAIKKPWYAMLANRAKKHAITQRELNEALKPPPYNLPDRYSTQIKIISLGILFATMWPVSLLLMGVTLIATYWVEKYNLLRVYERPPTSHFQMYLGAIKILSGVYFVFLLLDFWFNNSNEPIWIALWVFNVVMYSVYLILVYLHRKARDLFCCIGQYARIKKHLSVNNNFDIEFPECSAAGPYRPPVSESSVELVDTPRNIHATENQKS
eukprot:gb/GECH01003724.1/.p1 GENE.gb/GECH01003724.1/~~gb/GECH01003724.1/.p1  ORF type:complete len:762 (+),score=155.11 gb/GECH01003724.1/:1-2286(+)